MRQSLLYFSWKILITTSRAVAFEKKYEKLASPKSVDGQIESIEKFATMGNQTTSATVSATEYNSQRHSSRYPPFL